MSTDARFEDAGEKPLRLMARDADDVQVISALVQDSIFPSSEISWLPGENRFAMLLNRYRWENTQRTTERVQSVLVFDCVETVKTDSVDATDKDQVLSLLSIELDQGEGCAATYRLILAGDGEIKLEAECIEVILQDATRPYKAPSRKTPAHKLDS
ncbi:MAG: DUF2948 family protein [Pseudomonadota bacterium]